MRPGCDFKPGCWSLDTFAEQELETILLEEYLTPMVSKTMFVTSLVMKLALKVDQS